MASDLAKRLAVAVFGAVETAESGAYGAACDAIDAELASVLAEDGEGENQGLDTLGAETRARMYKVLFGTARRLYWEVRHVLDAANEPKPKHSRGCLCGRCEG